MSGYVVVATVNAQGVSDSKAQTLRNVRDALPGVAIAGLQEVKNLRGDWSLRERLSRRTMGVAQVTRTEATAGVALVWDKSRVRAVRGSRRIEVGVRPRGAHMLTRYLLAVDLVIDRELTVTAIVAHRPPKRYDHLWPAYDKALADLIKQARHPVVVFTDNNSGIVPAAVRELVKARARRIDMFLTSSELRTGHAFDLPATGSDHRPVGLKIWLGQ